MVRKCCFCFSLKYGNLAFAAISLASRLSSFFMLVCLSVVMVADPRDKIAVRGWVPLFGLSMGWILATSFFCHLVIKGILEGRAMLLYPYIAVVTAEIIFNTVLNGVLAVMVSRMYCINIFLNMTINLYIVICLVSLYKKMKCHDKEMGNVKI